MALKLLTNHVASSIISILVLFAVFAPVISKAQQTSASAKDLKALDVEELLNVEVSLVSRTPQKLSEASSSVQVITGEEIRRSGATNIADALRLVTNLQVAQFRSNAWIVGSRGFNALFTNKLLVMIDGRTVYTPLFAGVIWDMQNVLLEDVEKIEVVSGPGGALWGANAVNGVINIVTKNTRETKGLFAAVTAGTLLQDQVDVRWGGRIGAKTNYKIFGQHFDRASFKSATGVDFHDDWSFTQGGFQVDVDDAARDRLHLRGNIYSGVVNTVGDKSDFNGQNILAKWQRRINDRSGISLQAYYDRYFKRDATAKNADEMVTADLDFQHNFGLGKRQMLVWGVGYRRVKDNFTSAGADVAILPARKNMDLLTAFVNDEIRLHDRWMLTVGAKFIDNVYTGAELQPSVRVGYTVNNKSTLWTSVSRAVRTPSRVDVDYFSPAVPTPGGVNLLGGPDFISEKALAYELGYRVKPGAGSAISVAAFYNVYNDMYSLEAAPGTTDVFIRNGTAAESWGAEISGSCQVTDSWRLRAGYTYFDKELRQKRPALIDPAYQANDAKNQVMLHSMSNLPFNINFDVVARYVDVLPASLVTPQVPSYFSFDIRLAYQLRFLELSVVGQNILRRRHAEFGDLQVPRSVYAKASLRF
ncbi:MAG: TonB-dependent receptor [Chitinophagaceae bacterium]|nr:MAG: TonB-dependent receptor [Chitinophagaceae bacterium]